MAPDDCPNCGGSGYVAKPVDMNGKSEGVAFICSKCPVCGAPAGNASSHPKPLADRTAASCDSVGILEGHTNLFCADIRTARYSANRSLACVPSIRS